MTDENGTQPAAQPATTPAPAPQPERRGDSDGIQDRIARAKRSAVNDLLTKFGVPDLDTLTALVTTGRAGDAEIAKHKTEAERLAGELTAAQKKATDLEAARVADRVDSKLNAIASAAKAEHPEDVIEYVRKTFSAETEKLMGADGKINETEAQRLIDEVKKSRPGWFLTGGPGSPSNRGGRVPDVDAKAKTEALADFRNRIKRMG